MKILAENDLIGRWPAPAMGAVSQSKSSPITPITLSLDENVKRLFYLWMRMSKDDQFRDQYIEQFDFPYCEEVSKYEKQAKIGQVKESAR